MSCTQGLFSIWLINNLVMFVYNAFMFGGLCGALGTSVVTGGAAERGGTTVRPLTLRRWPAIHTPPGKTWIRPTDTDLIGSEGSPKNVVKMSIGI